MSAEGLTELKSATCKNGLFSCLVLIKTSYGSPAICQPAGIQCKSGGCLLAVALSGGSLGQSRISSPRCLCLSLTLELVCSSERTVSESQDEVFSEPQEIDAGSCPGLGPSIAVERLF